MLLLHVVAMPAAARAGLVGLAAITSLAAGWTSHPCSSRSSAHSITVVRISRGPGIAAGGSTRAAMTIRTFVRSPRATEYDATAARLRAEEALARATTKIRRERAAMVVAQRVSERALPGQRVPAGTELDALVEPTSSLSRDLAMLPPPPLPPAPPAPVAPRAASAPSPADVSARDEAPSGFTLERGMRALAAIAFFLIGLA